MTAETQTLARENPRAVAADISARRLTRKNGGVFGRHWPIVFPILLTCFALRVWLDPRVRIAGSDFPPFSESIVIGGAFAWPHLWADLFFGFSLAFWQNSAPLWAVAAPLHSAGASFALIERIFWLWPYLLGAPLCGYYLCFRLTRNAFAAAFGALPFALNTWSIGLIERGHIPSLDAAILAGVTFPLAFDLTKRPSSTTALRLAVAVSFQALYDVRYAYESMLVLAFVACLSAPQLLRNGGWKRTLKTAAVLGFALVALNLDVVFPALFTPSAPSGWGTRSAFAQISHYGSLLSSFSTYYPFYHWVIGRDGFTESGVELPFFIVSLLAWSGLLATRRRRTSRTLLAIAALGTILVSESKSPFGGLNATLYEHVPGFFLFRDYSKFFGLLVPAYAAGLALGAATLLAAARVRFGWKRGFAAGALALASLAYAIVVRDVGNPLRRSNFAGAAALTSQGRATEAYITQNIGDARVLMVPGDVRFQRREQFIATASADHFALDPPPIGYAPFNAALDRPEAIFEMLASPLAPVLLSELRVKYVVVPDDRDLYVSWDARPQRWACLDFLRRQPWLHEIAHFGDNVVFATNAALGEPAFFAPRPVLAVGSPATLEGLVDSPLWTTQAAALLFSQMPASADWLSTVPNVAIGPTILDPDFPIGRGTAAAFTQRLAENLASERYRQRPYLAYVFNSAMLTKSLLEWNLSSTFAYHFKTSRPERASLTFLMEGRRRSPTVLVQNSGNVRAVVDPPQNDTLTATIACSRPADQIHQFDATGGAIAVLAGAAGKQLFLDNPCPVDYQGTVSLGVASGDALPVSFSITYGSVTRRFTALPGWLPGSASRNVSLDDVVLRPGLNLIQVTKASTRPLSIANAYTLTGMRATGSAPSLQPLSLSVRRSPSGDLVYASIDVPRPGMHAGYLDLFGPLQLPLDHHPLCTLKYSMSDVPGSFDLVLALRDRGSGKLLTLWTPMQQRQDADYDLYSVVKDGLQERFDNELAYHADDPRWTAEHFAQGPPTPDDYTLESARIAATWSVLDSPDVPHGTFVLLLRGVRLSTSTRSLGSAWSYPQSEAVSTVNVGAGNVELRGMRLLRIATAGGDDPRVDAQLVGFTPSGYRLATSLHVGDYVELSLQSDRHVSGTIIAESSDYVLIQDADNPPQRIARGSITSVLQQTVTRSAKFAVPLSASFVPTRLTFNVRSDLGLRLRLNLTYEAPDGTREAISAVDSERSDRDGLDVEPEFVVPGALVAGTVFDIGVPIDVTLAQPSSAQSISYDLDLWNIERFHFGGLRRRLVGLTMEFTEPKESEPAIHQYSLALSGLTLSRDQLSDRDVGRTAPQEPVAFLDGTPLTLGKTSPLTGTARYFTAQEDAGIVPAGDHVIASRSLQKVQVRAATLSRGDPATFFGGSVSDLRSLTPSETSGRLAGGGLLVDSRTYDPGWSMATWPQGQPRPALTGFALIDWLHSFGHMVPPDDHVPVNLGIDAFYIPPAGDAPREFLMIYAPEALNELGFGLTLGAIVVFLAAGGLLALRRRARAR